MAKRKREEMAKRKRQDIAKRFKPQGRSNQGKHCITLGSILFEVDTKYDPLELIGSGAYGHVCSATDLETEEKVAIKKIANVFDDKVTALRTLREIMLLRHLNHENVIALKDIMMPPHKRSFNDIYLVYELMPTDLKHIIRSPQPLSDEHFQFFLYQILQGLKYLHAANILHRDLKPANLLVNSNCDLKICDLGLARTNSAKEDQTMTEYVCTRWYRAPEVLLCCGMYNTSMDVWSVGCIFAELLGRKPLFPGSDSLNQLDLIVNVLGTPSEEDMGFIDNPRYKMYIKSQPNTPGESLQDLFPGGNTLALDLLKCMLAFDPRKRIDVEEALSHPYLSHLSDPTINHAVVEKINLEVDGEMELDAIRERIWQEAFYYHNKESVV